MSFRAGQHVRLRSLQGRPALNGAHATVVAAASDAEAAELEQKGRVKVSTALTGECLSLRIANVELKESAGALDRFCRAAHLEEATQDVQISRPEGQDLCGRGGSSGRLRHIVCMYGRKRNTGQPGICQPANTGRPNNMRQPRDT